MNTQARIISNTSWIVKSRIEGFGLKRLKENTIRSSEGLLHVIEKVTSRMKDFKK